MVPVERDTLSPEPVVYSFIHLYPSESPVKEPSHVSGENIWTPYPYPRGQKAVCCLCKNQRMVFEEKVLIFQRAAFTVKK